MQPFFFLLTIRTVDFFPPITTHRRVSAFYDHCTSCVVLCVTLFWFLLPLHCFILCCTHSWPLHSVCCAVCYLLLFSALCSQLLPILGTCPLNSVSCNVCYIQLTLALYVLSCMLHTSGQIPLYTALCIIYLWILNSIHYIIQYIRYSWPLPYVVYWQ